MWEHLWGQTRWLGCGSYVCTDSYWAVTWTWCKSDRKRGWCTADSGSDPACGFLLKPWQIHQGYQSPLRKPGGLPADLSLKIPSPLGACFGLSQRRVQRRYFNGTSGLHGDWKLKCQSTEAWACVYQVTRLLPSCSWDKKQTSHQSPQGPFSVAISAFPITWHSSPLLTML